MQALPELLRCAVLAEGKGATTKEYVRTMLEFIWSPLLDALSKVCEVDGGAGECLEGRLSIFVLGFCAFGCPA